MSIATRFAALLATGVLVVVAGCGSTPEGEVVAAPSDKETSYLDDPCTRPNSARLKRFHVTDDGFKPRKIVIRAGTPVAFINCGTKAHTVTKVSGRGPEFDSGPLEPRAKIDRTFAHVGTQKIVDRETGAKMTIRVSGLPGQPEN